MDIKILKDKLSDSAEDQTLINTKKTETEIKELSNKIAELVIKVNALQSSVDGLDTKVTTDELVADLATIADLTGTNINADVFNSDKHSFTTGLTGSHLTIQPGTIVYARDTASEAYCLVFWVSSASFIIVTPNQYIWEILNDYTFGLVSGNEFKYSYLGTGCSNTTSTSSVFRLINSGCTLKGNLNAEYSGTTEFSSGIVVDNLLQVDGDTYVTGDIDITGSTTVGGNIDVTGNITTNGNSEVDGTLIVKGDIIQQGSSYETHAEKVYTKDDIIITRDGAVSALTEGEYTGIQAKLYDGVNDGQLVFDKDGVARVGDVGDLQAIATREDSPTNGAAAVWDSTTQKYTSKEIDSTPTVDSTNLITSGGVYNAIRTRATFQHLTYAQNFTVVSSVNQTSATVFTYNGIYRIFRTGTSISYVALVPDSSITVTITDENTLTFTNSATDMVEMIVYNGSATLSKVS